MYRAKLENVVKNAEEVFIESGDILVVEPGRYIDNRTKWDPKSKRWVVAPIAWQNSQYWYVCPDCQELHLTNMVSIGSIVTGCCTDHEGKRHQYLDGKHFYIKREMIIFDDGC